MEKLNCKSLMIGDWVYNSSKEKCKVYAISNIFDSNIHLDNYDKPNDGCFELAFEVEPIPLTTEILQKNGFKEIAKKCYRWEYAKGIYIKADFTAEEPWIDISGSCYFTSPACRYLHELQHAMKLCGITLEIII